MTSYWEDVGRGVGLLFWVVSETVFTVVAGIWMLLALPIAALGQLAQRWDLPPEGANCRWRGESHDWESNGILTKKCTKCGSTKDQGHPGL